MKGSKLTIPLSNCFFSMMAWERREQNSTATLAWPHLENHQHPCPPLCSRLLPTYPHCCSEQGVSNHWTQNGHCPQRTSMGKESYAKNRIRDRVNCWKQDAEYNQNQDLYPFPHCIDYSTAKLVTNARKLCYQVFHINYSSTTALKKGNSKLLPSLYQCSIFVIGVSKVQCWLN